MGTPTPIPTQTTDPTQSPDLTESPDLTQSPDPQFSSEITWESENYPNDSSVDFSSNSNSYLGQENTVWMGTTSHSTESAPYSDSSAGVGSTSTDVFVYENDHYFDPSTGASTTVNALNYVYTYKNDDYFDAQTDEPTTENVYSNNVDAAGSPTHILPRDYNSTDSNHASYRGNQANDIRVDSKVNEYDSSSDDFDSSSSGWDDSSDDDYSINSDTGARDFDEQSFYSDEVLSSDTINNMLTRPLTNVDDRAQTMPMDNIHAIQLDNIVTSPSRRDPQQIREQINKVYDNTAGLMTRYPPSLDMSTFIPLPSQEELARRRETAANFDFDNIGDGNRLEVTTKYSKDNNQDRKLTMQYSVRNETNKTDPLPYASDVYNAHLQAASETFEGVRQGEQPRMPEILERAKVSGSQTITLAGDIYNKYKLDGSNQEPVTLSINHGQFDAESLEQAKDLEAILTTTVNGKSTLNMLRDYNTLHGTNYAIVGVTITMGDASKVPGYSTPNLAFHIVDHTNQEP